MKKFNWLELSEAEFMELADLEGKYPIASGRPVVQTQQDLAVQTAGRSNHALKNTARKHTRSGTAHPHRDTSPVVKKNGVAALIEPAL